MTDMDTLHDVAQLQNLPMRDDGTIDPATMSSVLDAIGAVFDI